MMSQFYLNKMAYIDHHPIPFRNLFIEDSEQQFARQLVVFYRLC